MSWMLEIVLPHVSRSQQRRIQQMR